MAVPRLHYLKEAPGEACTSENCNLSQYSPHQDALFAMRKAALYYLVIVT